MNDFETNPIQVWNFRSFMVTGPEWHGELRPFSRASRTIRDDRYLYIANHGRHPDHPREKPDRWHGCGKWPEEELYDLAAAPCQLNNLAANPGHAETMPRLKKQMAEYQRQTGDPRITGEMEIFEAARAMVTERKASGYKDEQPKN